MVWYGVCFEGVQRTIERERQRQGIFSMEKSNKKSNNIKPVCYSDKKTFSRHPLYLKVFSNTMLLEIMFSFATACACYIDYQLHAQKSLNIIKTFVMAAQQKYRLRIIFLCV